VGRREVVPEPATRLKQLRPGDARRLIRLAQRQRANLLVSLRVRRPAVGVCCWRGDCDDAYMNLVSICRRTARRTFGIGRLRPEQETAMVAVLKGRDAVAMLPTGFGKSLIYQIPALILERPTIVISPLIALMADQERALRSRGVP